MGDKVFVNRGPWAQLECPHCGRWPEFWIWRSEGLASEFNPTRICPWCKQAVGTARVTVA